MTMLVCAVAWASGDIDWDTPAAGQNLSGNAAVEMLKDYIRRVNETLVSSGAGKIDPCYELYPTFASLGLNGAEFAQHAEITVNMNATGITSLVLRMDNLTSFALIGGALVQQTSPNSITLDEAVSAVQAYVRKVQESNGNGVVESFEEQPILSQGTQTRLYGAYYPNQYHDNANWMQLTIIFPQPGSVDGGLLLNNDAGPTATPDPDGDEISGYFPFDGFQDSHLEVFVTPTPEPDSAAWSREKWAEMRNSYGEKMHRISLFSAHLLGCDGAVQLDALSVLREAVQTEQIQSGYCARAD